MISVKDLCWAAGFFEGEASFQSSRSTPTIQISQKQKQPLLKVQSLFKGTLGFYRHKDDRYWWSYTRHGKPAAGIMMTVYSLMSPWRKRQIKKALRKWQAGPGKGHKLNKERKRIIES